MAACIQCAPNYAFRRKYNNVDKVEWTFVIQFTNGENVEQELEHVREAAKVK